MQRSLFLAATAAVVVSGSADAQNQTFECGPLFFDQHGLGLIDDQVITRDLQMRPNPSVITGLRFDIRYDETDEFGNPLPDPFSWASQLGLVVNFDNVLMVGFGGSARNLGVLAGGYSLGDALGAVDLYDIWDFDGPVSDSPGVYTHEFFFTDPMFVEKPELLQVSMTDTFSGNSRYNSLRIEFIKVPTPASAVLLGGGCLAGVRRRR